MYFTKEKEKKLLKHKSVILTVIRPAGKDLLTLIAHYCVMVM